MSKNRLYIAATRHHVGKTTMSFPFISGLRKRGHRVGYMKPVSQGTESHTIGPGGACIDPDVAVVRDYFDLPHAVEHMGPIVVPPGYTRAYIDGEVSCEEQVRRVVEACDVVSEDTDTLVIEGTGHTGVGSIINMNNARVAKLLGADAVLVANGGLGSAFDELELQRVMMKAHGVRVRGVVLNGVRPEKLEMVNDYFTKLLNRNWGGVPLLGVVPDYNFLGQPTLGDLEDFFGGVLMTGQRDRRGHYPLERSQLVVTDLRRFMTTLEKDHLTRTMYITHCSRDDIILGFISHCQRMKRAEIGNFEAALLLCGHHAEDLYPAIKASALTANLDFPIMHVPLTTHATLLALREFVPKLNIRDRARSDAVVNHYEPFIDLSKLDLVE